MGKIVLDLKHAAELFAKNINMMVPLYLMASYAYYKQDDPHFLQIVFLMIWHVQCWSAGTI